MYASHVLCFTFHKTVLVCSYSDGIHNWWLRDKKVSRHILKLPFLNVVLERWITVGMTPSQSFISFGMQSATLAFLALYLIILIAYVTCIENSQQEFMSRVVKARKCAFYVILAFWLFYSGRNPCSGCIHKSTSDAPVGDFLCISKPTAA